MGEHRDGDDPSVIAPEEGLEEVDAGEASAEPTDFRGKAIATLEKTIERVDETHEQVQLRELQEWRDGEFKDNMRMIVEAQQDICAQEGDPKTQDSDGQEVGSCALGTRIFEQMFGEPWDSGEKAETPAN